MRRSLVRMSGWGVDNGRSSHWVYKAGGEREIIHPLSLSLSLMICCKDCVAAQNYEERDGHEPGIKGTICWEMFTL